MAALDFPNNPNVNDRFPEPPISGIPTWIWDGQKWRPINVGGGGGIAEAPTDGELYARKNSAWEEIHVFDMPQFEAATRGFIDGLQFVWLGNQATFRVTAGACSSDDNTGLIVLPQTDIRANALFAGGGNLDTGAVAQRWYHVFAIDNATFTSPSLLISASATTPTMPGGYAKKRRIFSYLTSPSPFNAEKMFQVEDTFHWPAMRLDMHLTTTASTSGRQLSTLASIPPGISVEAILTIGVQWLTQPAGQGFYIFPAFIDGREPSSVSNYFLTIFVSQVTPWASAPRLYITTDTSQRIAWWRSTGLPGQFDVIIEVDGWVDRRGG